jgi:predicted TIM-barrel fold metal-dependent hydrolase
MNAKPVEGAPVTGAAWILDAHVTAGETFMGHVDPGRLVAEMDEQEVRQAAIAPADRWLAVDNREGNDSLGAWLRQWPDRFWGYAAANPWFGARALDELERALGAGLIGLKLHPARQGYMLLEPIVEPLVALAGRRGVPVYVVTGVPVASLPLQLAELARRHPEANFIMGRSGRTDFALDLLPAARQAPNLFLETAYNAPGLVEAMLREFGASRVLFASDAPFTNLALEIRKLDRLQAGPAERAALFGGAWLALLGHTRKVAHARD